VLSRRYPLGIVSDAVVTPGLQLRRILQDVGLLHFFTVTVFSDEAGHSKPAAQVFHRAAAGLGVPVQGLVHIGDRSDKDIAGAEGVGARGVLYTGCKDRGHEATLRIAHLNELPALMETL
jgi:putative hydrolase of the HAD superfamily